MKKIFSAILVITFMLFGSAYAEITVIDEPFSIRSGIGYGMTLTEAKAIEDKNGVNSYVSSGIISYSGISIAGIPNSSLYFSADGYDWSKETADYKADFFNHTPVGLIRYSFGRKLSAEQAETIFESINENLTQKYGTPFCTDINNRLLIKTSAPIIDNFLYADWRADRTITGYAEWLVQYTDCYVLVSEIAYREKYKDDGTCSLCYRFISYDEMESIYAEIQNSQEQAKEEIANDL